MPTRRLQRPQKRVMLDLMGVPYRRHPAKVSEVDKLLAQKKVEEPERYQHALNVVTGRAVEMPVQEVSGEAADKKYLAEYSELLRQHASNSIASVFQENFEAINKATSKIDTYADEAGATLEAQAKRAVQESAKRFIRLEVKVGNQRLKKMNDVLPPQFQQLVELAAVRQNIMMVGPSGSGKTFLASKVAEAMSMKFSSISCSVGMSESQLTGYMLPTGAGGKFEYHASDFVNTYENGGVFLLDEMDAADENTLIIINKALANGSFTVPQRVKNPEVKRHKDFVCLAAMNTLGTGEDMVYTGRNALDGATLDRFRAGFVFVDYDDNVEAQLVDPDVLAWGRAIRQVIRRDKLERIMSTRVMLDFSKLKEVHGWDRDKWNKSYFADWSQSEKIRVSGIEHVGRIS